MRSRCFGASSIGGSVLLNRFTARIRQAKASSVVLSAAKDLVVRATRRKPAVTSLIPAATPLIPILSFQAQRRSCLTRAESRSFASLRTTRWPRHQHWAIEHDARAPIPGRDPRPANRTTKTPAGLETLFRQSDELRSRWCGCAQVAPTQARVRRRPWHNAAVEWLGDTLAGFDY